MINAISNRHVASIPAPVMHGQTYQGWKPCMDWCEEHFGNRGGWWYIGEGVFEFTDQEDYMIFTLMWGK